MSKQKVKLHKLVVSFESLTKFLTIELDGVTRMMVKRLFREVSQVLKDYDETRIEIVKKYGEPQNEEGSYRILPQNQEEFAKEFTALNEQEIELDFNNISASSLAEAKFATSDEILLDWLITDEEEEVKAAE